MDSRRQHQGMNGPLQSQQFPPLLQQGGGHPPRLPLPLPHPNTGFSPRPSSFSGPLAGQKRSNRSSDNGSFAKLFVASLPRNISEDEVRDLFGGFGNVLEVIFLKDKKTGLPQGCCFIKYANGMDAERAIRALDNQRTLPGGPAPLQVKFADGERDHSGPLEHKLFVGSLNKQANEQEIEEIFAPYGRVENVYLIRDDQKQSRGCAFVTFPEKEMAIAAISALNGVFRMAGCHQPIIVRFADPKRPRSGERETHRMGGPGPNYSPRSYQGGTGPNFNSVSNYNSHSHQGAGGPRGSGGPAMEAHGPGFGWRQGGGAGGMGLLPQAGILPLGGPSSTPARKGPLENPNSTTGIRGGGQGAPAISGQVPLSGVSPQFSQQQGFKESPLHKAGQGFGQPLPLQQQPMQQSLSNPPQHNQGQSLQGYSMPQSTDTRLQHPVSIGQYSSPQPGVQIYGQSAVVTSIQQPIASMSSQALQFQPLRQQDSQPNQQAQIVQPLQQVPQILPLQTLPSQMQSQIVAKETPQQAYVQPHQVMNQSSLQSTSLQSSWSIPVHQQALPSLQLALPLQQQAITSQQQAITPQQQAITPQQQAITPQQQAVSLIATPALTSVPAKAAPTVASCDWTEHTSPEGHKYYYNSSTGESRWEKPEEYTVFEKQLQQQQQLAHSQQQQQLLQQQQPQQLLQSQVQAHAQQLQPQQINPQYQQQQVLNHQPQQQVQQAPPQQVQPYQQPQPQMQLLQQPQLQQTQFQQQPPLLQQLPQLQQLQQQLQQSQPQLQQPQQFSQLPSGGTYQAIQGYAQVQSTSQPTNGIANGPQLQQFASNPQANGMLDPARGAQWMPSMQQGLPNQDYMWKSKTTGS